MRSVYRPEKKAPLKAELFNTGRRKIDLIALKFDHSVTSK